MLSKSYNNIHAKLKIFAEKTNIPQQKLDFYQDKLSFKIKPAKELSDFEIDLLMKFTWGKNSGSMMSSFLSKLKTNKNIKAYVCICYDKATNKTVGWSLAELRLELSDEDFDTIYMFKKLLTDINLVCHKFNNSAKQIATLFHQEKFKEVEKEINEIINYIQTNNFEKDKRFFEDTIHDFIYYANCFLDILKSPEYKIIYNTYVKEEYRNRRIGASLVGRLKDFISSKKFNIIKTIVSDDFEETPFASKFYEKSIDVKNDHKDYDYYHDTPFNEKQMKLFSKINQFLKMIKS